MGLLNDLCSYWLDCIEHENSSNDSFPLHGSGQTIIFPFRQDSFISTNVSKQLERNESTDQFFNRLNAQKYDCMYGYPIVLIRRDNHSFIVPLFIIRLSTTRKDNSIILKRYDDEISCGAQAFQALGLNEGELSILNSELIAAYHETLGLNSNEIIDRLLAIVRQHNDIAIIETINPVALQFTPLEHGSRCGIYNRCILFSGVSDSFNATLIQDLATLTTQKDLNQTSLNFFEHITHNKFRHKFNPPLLPYASNEYQLSALQQISSQKLSVITGPPGTGKSQFIANLIINLSQHGQSVLFVSHTGDAVNLVHERINQNFHHLVIRTGNKALRQAVRRQATDFLTLNTTLSSKAPSRVSLKHTWHQIESYRKVLQQRLRLEQRFERLYEVNTQPIEPVQRNIRPWRHMMRQRINGIHSHLIKYRLTRLPDSHRLEQNIHGLEAKYVSLSHAYVAATYYRHSVNKPDKFNAIESFINQLITRRSAEFTAVTRDTLSILPVWASTLKSLGANFPLTAGLFDYVIFDESSQIDLPSAAPALYRAKNAVIVGDPMQLSHITTLSEATDNMLAQRHLSDQKGAIYPGRSSYRHTSLYDAARRSLTLTPVLLGNHYRSQDEIIELCNRVFYQGSLRVMSRLHTVHYPSGLPQGLVWYDCPGTVKKHARGSKFNLPEIEAVVRLLDRIFEHINGTELSIGIVTPYSRQQMLLTQKIIEHFDKTIIDRHHLTILTAHRFQGSEKDIMIFSPVLATAGNGGSDAWYDANPQLLNVALSRARYLLCIVGDASYCASRPGILGRIYKTYEAIKQTKTYEQYLTSSKFATLTEQSFFANLNSVNWSHYGYRLTPKLVVGRYALDFALIGTKYLDIEIDGHQHQTTDGRLVLVDEWRDTDLSSQGWHILRYSKIEIFTNSAQVIAKIISLLN